MVVTPTLFANNSEGQFEHSKLMQTFENLLQNYWTEFLDITHKESLCMYNFSLFKWWCHLPYIDGEILDKDNLNIENLMQTFENLLV